MNKINIYIKETEKWFGYFVFYEARIEMNQNLTK